MAERVKCAICGEVHTFAEKLNSTNPHLFKYPRPKRIKRSGGKMKKQAPSCKK